MLEVGPEYEALQRGLISVHPATLRAFVRRMEALEASPARTFLQFELFKARRIVEEKGKGKREKERSELVFDRTALPLELVQAFSHHGVDAGLLRKLRLRFVFDIRGRLQHILLQAKQKDVRRNGDAVKNTSAQIEHELRLSPENIRRFLGRECSIPEFLELLYPKRESRDEKEGGIDIKFTPKEGVIEKVRWQIIKLDPALARILVKVPSFDHVSVDVLSGVKIPDQERQVHPVRLEADFTNLEDLALTQGWQEFDFKKWLHMNGFRILAAEEHIGPQTEMAISFHRKLPEDDPRKSPLALWHALRGKKSERRPIQSIVSESTRQLMGWQDVR